MCWMRPPNTSTRHHHISRRPRKGTPWQHMVLVLAAVEGGGTTFVVAIAHDDPTNVVERAEFPTTTPQEEEPGHVFTIVISELRCVLVECHRIIRILRFRSCF